MTDNITQLAAEQDKPSSRKSQRDELVDLVLTQPIELFHSEDREGFASIELGAQRETYPIRSTSFRQQVSRLFYQASGRAAANQALREALDTLEGKSIHDGPLRPVAVRCAELYGAIYIDLGTPDWVAVKVTPEGWTMDRRPPVRFYRPRSVGALPVPAHGGSLDELRPFVNCPDDRSFALLKVWCVSVFRPTRATPVLILQGEQGSAKSTTAKLLQSILDPGKPQLRSAPKTEQDLVVAARHRRVLAFDNLSGVQDWLSDALCRICTGGGYGARQLFTDTEEVVFEGTRAIILTGIDELARRHDLTDRALVVTLPPISEERREGDGFLDGFETIRPRVFGALLETLASGLRRLPDVRLARKPRMADFAILGTACEPALGLPAGGFMVAFQANRSEAAEQSLESDLVAVAVRDFMVNNVSWEGPPTQLHETLSNLTPDQSRNSPAWPRSASAMSSRLKRAAPVLRLAGITLEHGKVGQGPTRRRGITLSKLPAPSVPLVRLDPTAIDASGFPGPSAGTEAHTRSTQTNDPDARGTPPGPFCGATKDGQDDGDAQPPVEERPGDE